MSDYTVADHVAAGVAFLDGNVPGWDLRIDLGELDLNHCNKCILGQLYGDPSNDAAYLAEARELGIRGRLDDLGFEAPDSYSEAGLNAAFDELTAEWARVITERRSAA